MFPYHLTHLALPTIHLKPQKETVLHSSFPLSPCRHSLPLLPESNLRHLECPHADRVPRGPPHDTLVAMIPLSNGHTAPSRALAVVNLRHREGLHADAILNRISRTAACRLSPGASHDLYSSCELSMLSGDLKELASNSCLGLRGPASPQIFLKPLRAKKFHFRSPSFQGLGDQNFPKGHLRFKGSQFSRASRVEGL